MAAPHILIVDDVAKNIQIAANVLRSVKCHISFAQSGEKALEIIAKEKINLILLDVMMPGMNGLDLCKLIFKNKANKSIKVIFLTAKTDVESITQAFSAGGVDYITKPFNNEELLARVKTQLDLGLAIDKIKKQNTELAEINTLKDKLFSIIAHDLRNPFNGLLVLTDILKYKLDKLDKKEIRNMIDLIYLSSKDGYDLLENLLEWSRSQRNQLSFNPAQVDVKQLIAGNIHLIQPLATSKNVDLSSKVFVKQKVYADSHMLDTIIRNLITNAIKFTPHNGKVHIEASETEKSLQISVRDSGMGIPENNIEHLFNPIKMKSTAGTANERGTGLGLLLCKEFIDRHQGEITVESKLNQGSEFKIVIPKKKPEY